jgi:site-specific DNA recombinase
MNRAVLYARVSSALQEKERTIDSQVAELKKQVRVAGDKLVKQYTDDGYSGAMLSRPAMDELRKDLRTNLFDVIYILNSDRIARDVAYQNIIIAEFLQYKKRFIINGQDYVNNPENKFALTVLGAVSELERAKIMERNRRGRQHRLSQGLLMSNGNHIFGYTYNRRTPTTFPSYEINEQEAKIVRNIFETYANGEIGIRTIAQQLKNKGIKARNKLSQSHLKYILQNETYTGVKYFNSMTDSHALGQEHTTRRGKRVMRERSEWIAVKIPTIIPKGLFDKANAKLQYNRECYRNSQRTQLLSNLVYCGRCDSRCFAYRRHYTVERKDGKRLYQKVVYRCRMKGIGHNPEIDTRVIELCAIGMVRDIMVNPNQLKECIDFLHHKGQVNRQRTEHELQEVNNKIKTITNQKNRILDLYASGGLEREEYIRRIRIYEDESKQLQVNRTKLLNLTPLFQKPEIVDDSITAYCKKAKAQFEKCSGFGDKRKFFLDHVKKVAYLRNGKTNDKINLTGFIPIKIENQKESVSVEFKIEQIVSRVELLRQAREMDSRNGSWGGFQIFSKEYGKLVMAKTPEIQQV